MDLLSNCVAHYKLNDCARNTIVLDSRGYANGAAQRNTQFLSVDGKVGGALDLNGTTDYVNVPYNSRFNFGSGDFSFCFWLKTTAETAMILSHFKDGYGWEIDTTNGKIGISSSLVTMKSAESCNNGEFRNIIITFKQSAPKAYHIYLDGVETDTGSLDTANIDVDVPLLIGKDTKDIAFFDGSLDNIMIFNKALSAEEVAFLYNDGAGTEDLGISAGFMSIASEAAANLIANSATFQASVGAEDAATALLSVYIGAYEPDDPEDPDAGWTRPFALVRNPGSGGIKDNIDSGEFKITFEKEIPAAYRDNDNQQNAQLEFEAWAGQIIAECMELSQSAGYQIVRSFEISEGPYRYSTDPLKNTMGCACTYRWGLGG